MTQREMEKIKKDHHHTLEDFTTPKESFRDVSTALKVTPIQVNKIDRQTLMVFKVNVLLMCQDKHDVYPPEKTKTEAKIGTGIGPMAYILLNISKWAIFYLRWLIFWDSCSVLKP